MFEKFKETIAVFKAGESVADAVKAKQWTLAINASGTLIIILLQAAHAFGWLANFSISDEQINAITVGIASFIGVFNHGGAVISTDKISLTGRTAIQPMDYPNPTATDIARQSAKNALEPMSPQRSSDTFDKQRERDSEGG